MKKPAPLALLLLASLTGLASSAFASTQTWNPGGAGGGTGTWSGNNWDAAAAWVNGNIALFGGTAGTVTVGTQTASGITFNTSGYTLSSGTLTLAPAAGSNFVFTTNGGTDTISATFTSAAGIGITKTGAGTLAPGTVGAGGTAASPDVTTVTGGTFNSSPGDFSSILSIQYGSSLGTQPTNPTVQLILDAGTLNIFGTGANAVATNRTIQVNAAGGAIIDAGGNTYNSRINNNAGSTSSLYLSNPSSTTMSILGAITGAGSVTFEGAGTLSLQGGNTYTGGTVINKGTLQFAGSQSNTYSAFATYSGAIAPALANYTLTLASGIKVNLQGSDLQFDLSNSASQLLVPSNSVTVSSVNLIRLSTGSLTSLTPGAYTLISAATGSLTGTFELDGAATLNVPVYSLIKLVGSFYYRLTLQNSSTAEQVVIAAAPSTIINVMPLGSSITEGYSAQGSNYAGGGYRSQLYQSLVNDGRFTPNMIGSSVVLDNASTAGYNVLTGANQLRHEGHGGYTTSNILTNLNANAGTGSNNGGFWLAPNNGVNPDYTTLSIGGNDYGASSTETTGPLYRADAIVTAVEALRPAANVIFSNLFYRTQTTGPYIVGDLQNTYYNPLVPVVVFNHVLAGQHVSFCDSYDTVTPNNNVSTIGSDGIHPLTSGYEIFATTWYNVLAFGSAYWTGGLDSQWSTVTAGNTNFAQNYQLTVPRQTALTASADVYFNHNTAALPTTLGQDTSVRSVNFTAGATGPVTIGGSNTLTIGGGGITVQSGSGPHTITANVALGAPLSVAVGNTQTWGNVSSNPLTVSGAVSGSYGLTTTGSYSIQAALSYTSSTITTQTYSGTGAIVLNGPNTYSGGTTVSSGTLVVGNTSGSGTGNGSVSVASGATLTDNGSITGAVTVNGGANGTGIYGGAVTVSSGATFSGAATVNGLLTINSGGFVSLPSGGTLIANGGVVNNGTIRLERGASLAVGNGTTFTNNGTLDVITGSYNAPGGFTNNGVVLTSSLIQTNSAALSGGTFTVTINSYTGHMYQLQVSSSPAGGTFTNLGSALPGAAGTVLTFTDNSPAATQGFYRVEVDP